MESCRVIILEAKGFYIWKVRGKKFEYQWFQNLSSGRPLQVSMFGENLIAKLAFVSKLWHGQLISEYQM